MIRSLRIGLIRALLTLLVVYAAVVGLLFHFQRSLIYLPPDQPVRLPTGFDRVTLRTADGLDLAAAWRPGRAGLPPVIWFHSNGDTLGGSATGVADLVARGHPALLVEYRGYGRNPGAPDERGLYADGRAARHWLKDRGYPPDRHLLIGHSLGSGVAAQLAAEQAPAALVLISPFTSIPDVVRYRFNGLLPADALVRDRFASIGKVARIAAPVLVLHDRGDSAIPIAHGEALAAAAGAELLRFSGHGHQLAYAMPGRRAVAEWVAQLTQRQIPAGT